MTVPCILQDLKANAGKGWKVYGRRTCLLTLTFSCLFWVIETQAADNMVTCETSAYQEGRPTVTCHFPINLNETQKSFIVEFYPPQSLGNETFVVLTCQWKKSPPGQTNCFQPSKVFFNNVITDRVVFSVDPSIVPSGGHFKCALVPPGGTTSQRCLLNYTEVTTSATTTQITSDEEDPCPTDPELLETSGEIQHPGIGGPVTLAVLLSLLCAVAACCAMFYLLLRRHGTSIKALIQLQTAVPSTDENLTNPPDNTQPSVSFRVEPSEAGELQTTTT